jgi:hypothetical protein
LKINGKRYSWCKLYRKDGILKGGEGTSSKYLRWRKNRSRRLYLSVLL